jgi:TPR repeat protein
MRLSRLVQVDEDSVRQEIWTLINGERFAEALSVSKGWADKGSLSARMFLGWLHERGMAVPQQLDIADRWYREAASLGLPEAQFYLGRLCLTRGMASEAIEWFERAASHDYPPAAFRLSRIYSEGRITEADVEKSDFYLSKAARLGHFYASKQMAVRLIKGTRTKRNVVTGVRLFISTLVSGARMIIKDPHTTSAWYMDG